MRSGTQARAHPHNNWDACNAALKNRRSRLIWFETGMVRSGAKTGRRGRSCAAFHGAIQFMVMVKISDRAALSVNDWTDRQHPRDCGARPPTSRPAGRTSSRANPLPQGGAAAEPARRQRRAVVRVWHDGRSHQLAAGRKAGRKPVRNNGAGKHPASPPGGLTLTASERSRPARPPLPPISGQTPHNPEGMNMNDRIHCHSSHRCSG